MCLSYAAPAGNSSKMAEYIANLEAFVEHVWATTTPEQALTFLWGIFYLYLALLAAWRLNYLCQRLRDRYASYLN